MGWVGLGDRRCIQGPEREYTDGKHDDSTQTNCDEGAVRQAPQYASDGCDEGAVQPAAQYTTDCCGEGVVRRALEVAGGGWGAVVRWGWDASEGAASAGTGARSGAAGF